MWRRIVSVSGYFLAAVALAALGGDILGWARGDGFEFTIIGRHWYAINPGSLNLSQAVVQRYIHPWLWDPAIVAVLNVPTAPLIGALGIGLLVIGRAPQKRKRVFY